MNDLEHKLKVLEGLDNQEIIDKKRLRKALDSEAKNQLQSIDTALLDYILKRSDITLSDLTNRSYRDELDFWDTKHLAELAQNIDLYISDSKSKEKFRYILEHSIKDDLTETLSSNDPNDKFSIYNTTIIEKMKELGIDIESWLSSKDNLFYTESLNQDNYFRLEFSEWKRDFRREYSIGNISECCIAVNNIREEQNFKTVLLDYFLDLSIKVIHIKKSRKGVEEKIGQIYFVGLEKKEENTIKSCLGITSIEIKKSEKKDFDLVPAVVRPLLNSNGYQETYNYESTFMGQRFNLFTEYIRKRKQDIGCMLNRLRQKRQNYNQERNRVKVSGGDISETIEKINTIDKEITVLDFIKDNIYTQKALNNSRKIGLKRKKYPDNLISDGFYGTNYLDIFGLSDNGFFNLRFPPRRTIKGYLIKDYGYLNRLESTLSFLKDKYNKKRRRMHK